MPMKPSELFAARKLKTNNIMINFHPPHDNDEKLREMEKKLIIKHDEFICIFFKFFVFEIKFI